MLLMCIMLLVGNSVIKINRTYICTLFEIEIAGYC